MWSATSTAKPTLQAPYSPFSQSSWDPYLSISRPYVTLRVGSLPRRGYVLTLTDALGRTVSTPTIPVLEIEQALNGQHVDFRNGAFGVEFTPVDGMVHIKGGPLAGLRLDGYFAPEVLAAAIHGAGEA